MLSKVKMMMTKAMTVIGDGVGEDTNSNGGDGEVNNYSDADDNDYSDDDYSYNDYSNDDQSDDDGSDDYSDDYSDDDKVIAMVNVLLMMRVATMVVKMTTTMKVIMMEI